jgi:hypothetical protein
MRPDGNDLTSYLLSAEALWEGSSPYTPVTPFPYVYPMLLAFVLIPWLVLPYGVAVVAWFAASAAALVVVLWKSSHGVAIVMAATVVVTFAAIQNTLLNGQVNFFVVLCCVMAVVAARETRDGAAGAWLGAGIALKLMPAVLILYFVVRRRYRAVAVTAIVAIALSLVPAALLGASGWQAYADYTRGFLLPVLQQSPTARHDPLAFSLAGVVSALIGPGSPRWINAACAVMVVAAIVAADIFRWRPRRQDLAAGAGYMLAIVLVSPKSEVHHLAFIIPAVAVCLMWVWTKATSREGWAMVGISAAAGGLAFARLAGPAHGMVLCAALVLLGAALVGLTPSSASQTGTRNSSSSSPSYRAAVP